MKRLLILISIIGLGITHLIAQTNQPYLIQYKNGEKALIDIPSTSKIVANKDYIEISPYGYTLRLQSYNIKKHGIVTPQYVADSLTAKTIRVNCENDKVSLSNPQNQGYSMIYDKNFHQVSSFLPEEAQEIEFNPSTQKAGFYWLSNGKILVGVNNKK